MTTRKINVGGVATQAGMSLNRVLYLPEELAKFAPTQIDKPILKNHSNTTKDTIGLVTDSVFNNGTTKVEYAGWVKDDGEGTLEKIEDRRIKEVSIGAVVGRLVKEKLEDDFYIAKDMKSMELSLTPTPAMVGTSISQTLKGLSDMKKPEDFKNVKPVFEDVAFINDSFTRNEEEKNVDVKDRFVCPYCEKDLHTVDDLRKHLDTHTKEADEEGEEDDDTCGYYGDAVWTTKFVNNLPDSAFAIIMRGGKKDADGKTKPRSLRKLPHHGATVKSPTENTSIDKPHLRNALARAPQMKASPAMKSKAISHLEKHAKALKIGKREMLELFGEDVCKELESYLMKDIDKNDEEVNKMVDEPKVEVKVEATEVTKKIEEINAEVKADMKAKEEELQKREEELKVKEDAIAKEKREKLEQEYNDLTEEKKVTARDISKMSDETVTELIEQLKLIEQEEPATPEGEGEGEKKPEEEPASEGTDDKPKDETKGKVGKEIETDVEPTSDDIAVEKSEFGTGYAIYKESYDKDKYKRLTRGE